MPAEPELLGFDRGDANGGPLYYGYYQPKIFLPVGGIVAGQSVECPKCPTATGLEVRGGEEQGTALLRSFYP
jgi:hypothetical protein